MNFKLDLYLTINQFEKIFLRDMYTELLQNMRGQLGFIPKYPKPKLQCYIEYYGESDTSVPADSIFYVLRVTHEPKKPVTIRSSLKVLLFGIVVGILLNVFMIGMIVVIN